MMVEIMDCNPVIIEIGDWLIEIICRNNTRIIL
jgi:hypothetical protein